MIKISFKAAIANMMGSRKIIIKQQQIKLTPKPTPAVRSIELCQVCDHPYSRMGQSRVLAPSSQEIIEQMDRKLYLTPATLPPSVKDSS